MFDIIGLSLVSSTFGRCVQLEELELTYKVRAMVQMGFDPEVARVFAFSGAERSKVIELAKRKKVLL
jgi:hypothetical protein